MHIYLNSLKAYLQYITALKQYLSGYLKSSLNLTEFNKDYFKGFNN